MKVALLITTYNRPEYLKQCLWSLERADLSKIDEIVFVDDCSVDHETLKLIDEFIDNHNNSRLFKSEINHGVKNSLLSGYGWLFLNDSDIVINIDGDAIVRPDFIEKLIDQYVNGGCCKGGILTGFHSVTKNANGTDRHKIIDQNKDVYFKQSVGGINLCIDKYAYKKFVKPALEIPGNWDHNSCINAGGAYCLKQSVIQHIGIDSSMNHNEEPDIADDFYYWDLPTVTLLGVDNQKERLNKAKEICTKWIKFGSVVMLNPDLHSKEAYSEFIIKQGYKFVDTSHCLIFQHDGFVNNWQAWDNDFLNYDYIGAPWYYVDGMAVGNGGFSLRSKRLMEIVATDPNIQFTHPEDHHICRTYRPYLEKKYGIKFAPLEVAERFSFEGYMQPSKHLSDQFGKHGIRVMQKAIRTEKYVVNQFLSLGDILFLIPLIRELMNEGNTILWPIADQYFDISKHFTDIKFVRKSQYPDLPYESMQRVNTPHGQMLPYRFASEIMGRNLTKCMDSKYELYHHSVDIWRNLYWSRDIKNEAKLIELLNLPENFILVNRTFGHEAKMSIIPDIKSNLPTIEMRNIPGFTLIDWLGIAMLAKEMHISNSSFNYILELGGPDIPIHIYKRQHWGEVGFSYTKHLWRNKNFIYHE
jgi:glycosyltransferase involved in cell wall biosynthesis